MMEDLTVISGSGERFELRLPGSGQLEQTISFISEALELPSGECRQKIAGALRGFFPQHYSSSLEKISHSDVRRLISAFALLLQNPRAEAFFSRTNPLEGSEPEEKNCELPFDENLNGENIPHHFCSHSGKIRQESPASTLNFPDASDLLPYFPGATPEVMERMDTIKKIPLPKEKHTDVFLNSVPPFAEHPFLFPDLSDTQETHTENTPEETERAGMPEKISQTKEKHTDVFPNSVPPFAEHPFLFPDPSDTQDTHTENTLELTGRAHTLKEVPHARETHTDVFLNSPPSFADHPSLFPDTELKEVHLEDTPMAHSEVTRADPENSLIFSFLPRFSHRIDDPSFPVENIFLPTEMMKKNTTENLSEDLFLTATAVSDVPGLSTAPAALSLFSPEPPPQETVSVSAVPEIIAGEKTFSPGEMRKFSGTGMFFLPESSPANGTFGKYTFSPSGLQKEKGEYLTILPGNSGKVCQQELQFSDGDAADFSFHGVRQKELRYGDAISATLISITGLMPAEELSPAVLFSFSGDEETSPQNICDGKRTQNTASAEAPGLQRITGAPSSGYDDAAKTAALSDGKLKYIEKAPLTAKTDKEMKRFEKEQKPSEKTLAQRENVLTVRLENRKLEKELPEEDRENLTAGNIPAFSGKSFSLKGIIIPGGKDDGRAPGTEAAFSGSTAAAEYAVFSEKELFQDCEKVKDGTLFPSYDLTPVPTEECETRLLIRENGQTTHKETQDLNIYKSLAPAAETCGETASAVELVENSQFFSAEKQREQNTAAEAETSDFQQTGSSRELNMDGRSGKIPLQPEQYSIRLRQENKISSLSIGTRKSPETESFSVGLKCISATAGTEPALTLSSPQTKMFCLHHQKLASETHSEDQLFSFSALNAASPPENRITTAKIDGSRDKGLRNGHGERTKQVFTEKTDKHRKNTVPGEPLQLFEEQKQEFSSQAHSQATVEHGNDISSAFVDQKSFSQESSLLSDRKVDLRQKVLKEEHQTFDDREGSYSDEVISAAFCYKWQLEYAASLPRELLKRCLAIAGVRFRERKAPPEQEIFSADDVDRAIRRGKAALEKLKERESSSL